MATGVPLSPPGKAIVFVIEDGRAMPRIPRVPGGKYLTLQQASAATGMSKADLWEVYRGTYHDVIDVAAVSPPASELEEPAPAPADRRDYEHRFGEGSLLDLVTPVQFNPDVMDRLNVAAALCELAEALEDLDTGVDVGPTVQGMNKIAQGLWREAGKLFLSRRQSEVA